MVRQWAWTGGPDLKVKDLRDQVRKIRSQAGARKLHIAFKMGVEQARDGYLADLRPLWGPDLGELGKRIWSERVPTPTYIRNHFGLAANAIGRPELTPHGLRHAFCSWLAMMGEDMKDIAAWVHHARTAITEEVYTHLRLNGRDRVDANRKSVFTMRSELLKLALGEKP